MSKAFAMTGLRVGYAVATRATIERLERVLTIDPGLGVVRHADAGYDIAIETARNKGVRMPSLDD